jgi:hypothetical protein
MSFGGKYENGEEKTREICERKGRRKEKGKLNF